ncbi:replication initiation protein RepC [Ancylobacter vacuolatus]|uniref:replication initiation protein RepC n=1 Tax=Ancylobacter vacuolatus TaxID=223389 RepID=UPI0027D90668|nr:replication initiation protein RepC [Ancylobacter vacuolatus]
MNCLSALSSLPARRYGSWHLGGQIRHLREFIATTQLVGRMLGICPSAWNDARRVLGEQYAAITLAAIYERSDKISNANGYLRSLTPATAPTRAGGAEGVGTRGVPTVRSTACGASNTGRDSCTSGGSKGGSGPLRLRRNPGCG